MENIKNIVFDMGGVLIDLDREACIAEFRRLGYPQADELLDPYRQKGIFLSLEKGEVTPEGLYEHINSGSKTPISPSDIDNALFKFLAGIPEYKLDMLLGLRERFNIYMLSNTNPIMFSYIDKLYFSRSGRSIRDYFDRLFLSYEMKMLKPDEEIYLKMLSDGGMEPSETLFIDDSQANIDTAAGLGIHTYHAKPEEDFRHIFEGL